ncbi:MAG: hypothetical protein CMF49_10195 [Legionellales bacterium]|nr:hypothetical protein [Legionellales bacterium]MAZ40473.1 hypothetical protein [Legionellales bacterium]|tara:strand:- start:411 stop:2906 length:2496 start_codon:yes stop_codon:yes gene_type:complete
MSPINALLKSLKKESGVSKHCPYSHLLSPSIVECIDGKLMSVIAVDGVSFDTADEDVIKTYKQIWHDAITRIDDKCCIYVTMHREQQDVNLSGEFKNTFLKDFDKSYHQQFKNKAFYKNTLFITVMINGVSETEGNKTNFIDKVTNFIQKTNNKTIKEAKSYRREKAQKMLNEKVSHLLTALSKFSPELLGARDKQLGYSALLAFLAKNINALEIIPFRAITPSFGHQFGFNPPQNKQAQFYPESNLSQYLTASQIFFGDYILFKSANGINKKFGAMLSIKNYPSSTCPYITDKLLTCDAEFIISNAFFPLDNQFATKSVELQRAKLNAVGSKAHESIEQLAYLESDIAGDRVRLGLHQMNILVLGASKSAVDKGIIEATKSLQDAGVVAVRETFGEMPAFWSILPGNQKYMARLSSISSENFADFTPLHNYRLGYKDENFLGSAVTLLSTPSNTPYFFNFHTKGTKENPSKGHYIIIGGNDSGKTATIAGFDAQFSRYAGRSIFFDRDRGLEIYVRACGGFYSVLSPEQPENCQFNPLQLDDTEVNRQYCREWLALLVKEENEEMLPASIQKQLDTCIEYAFRDLDKKHRVLSNITKVLPINFPRWDALNNWLKSENGKYGYIFDNPTDAFTYFDKMGFDLTHFLSREPKPVLAAIMHYLFFRVESSLDSRPTHCVFDEGWQMLQEKILRDRIAIHLATGRKKRLFIGIGTQSLKSIAENPISHAIVDNIATGIYFANNNAKPEYYIDILGLTEAEFNFIKNTNPAKRLMLIKQGKESVICQFNLTGMDKALAVLSANEKTTRLAQQIISEVGTNPDVWLPLFHQKRVLK